MFEVRNTKNRVVGTELTHDEALALAMGPRRYPHTRIVCAVYRVGQTRFCNRGNGHYRITRVA